MTELKDDILLRWAVSEDFDELGEVMFDAVRHGESPYSDDQRQAWMSAPHNDKAWHDRLGLQQIIVAAQFGNIIGFMGLAEHGYIDFSYIRPEAQKSGLFRKLFAQIEQRAMREQHNRLWVHASLQAQPAFTAMGFRIIKSENVSLGGQMFERYEMEKHVG